MSLTRSVSQQAARRGRSTRPRPPAAPVSNRRRKRKVVVEAVVIGLVGEGFGATLLRIIHRLSYNCLIVEATQPRLSIRTDRGLH